MYFILLEEWNPPEYVIHTTGNTFQPDKRGAHAESPAESLRCEVNTLGKLACNFSTFCKVSPRDFLLDQLENLNGVTDFSHRNF